MQHEFAALFNNCVRFIIFEPGYFRTEVFSNNNMVKYPSVLPEYEAFNKAAREQLDKIYHNENGDSVKGVARMIDIITSTGVAAGRDLPPRMPLGSDSLEGIRAKCLATLKLCDEWEDLIVSTDVVAEPEQKI